MKNKKIVLICIAAAVMSLMLLVSCGETNSDNASDNGAVLKCSVEINCEKAIPQNEKLSLDLPEDGVILSIDSYEFHEGDTASDVLKSAMDENNILYEFSGTSDADTWIEGISNLYNGDCGDMSGWMFIVNGELASEGVGAAALNDGDKITIAYSFDCGEDLGFTYQNE